MRLLVILLFAVEAFAQVTTPLTVTPGTTATGEIRLREKRSNGEHYVGLKAADSVTANKTWTLPPIDGTLGQALVTNGAGVLSWSSVAGGSFPVCASTTGNDTYTCTVSGFTAYSAGYCIVLYADTANTGAATVDISGVGAQNILQYGGSSLVTNDILANTPIMICHNGTDFLLPPSATGATGAFLDGGNSFGATATLGTNDAYDLRFERNNSTLVTLGAGGIDMAPAVTNFYAKVRKLEIADAALGSAFWDVTASASVGSSEYRTRDNAGSRWIVGYRTFSGSPANYAHVFTDWLPAKRDTTDGDALTDAAFPSLGSTGRRWLKLWTDSAELTNGITVGTTGTFGGNVTLNGATNTMSGTIRPGFDGIGSIGDATYKYGDVYTYDLTASGATYLQTTGIGEASPAKGLLSVYGHNGYAYTPFNQVVAARFRTGANSAILFGTTIPNTSGWTRGMYWTYLTEDWTLSRFKDDESAAPINDLYVAADGRVGIGTAAVTEELTVNGSIDVIGSGDIEVGGTTVIDSSRNATVVDLTVTGSCTGCSGLPAVDTSSIVKGSADATKLMRFEVDGFTTATTRTLTPQNASYTLAGTDLAQTFTAAQTFNNTVNLNNGFSTDSNVILTSTRVLSNIASVTQSWVPTTNNTYNIGSSSDRWATVYATSLDFSSGGSIGGNLTLNGATNTMSGTLRPGFTNLGSIGDSSYRYATAYFVNLDVSGTCTGCGGLPVADGTSIVKGSVDATKLLRFEVDGFSTATTRTLTPQNDSYTIAGINIGQTFTATQTFNATVNLNDGFYTGGVQVLSSTRILANVASVSQTVLPTSNNTYALGSSTYRWSTLYGTTLDVSSTGSIGGNLTLNGATNTMSGTLRPGFDGLGSIGDSSYKYGALYTYNAYFYGTVQAPNGFAGQSVTITVRDSAGTGTCTLTFSGGLKTGGTC